MDMFFLKIAVIFTSLLAWVILVITGWVFFRSNYHGGKVTLVTYILSVLVVVIGYNFFYEGLFLLDGMLLMSPLNIWCLIIIIPLCFFYIRFMLGGNYPGPNEWFIHFFIPVGLLMFYLSALFSQPVHDRITRVWSDIWYRRGEWWVLFRIVCLLYAFCQMCLYVPFLVSIWKKEEKNTLYFTVKREISALILFFFISCWAITTPMYIARIIFNLYVAGIVVYLWKSPVFSGIFYWYGAGISWLSFIYDIVRNEKDPVTEPRPYKSINEKMDAETGSRLSDLMSEEKLYRDPGFSLSRLTALMATNETYLSRYLNTYVGMSFPEWVNNYRIDEAEVLLRENLTMTEISERVGFQSLSSFYQAFRNRHHIPPAQWRKRNCF